MGLNIREIVSRKELDVSSLKGKTLCVDAFNTLYQFLTTIRQADGAPLQDEHGNITSHLSGIFYRNIFLISEGIKLVYVFDGEPPELKGKIHKIRGNLRDFAKDKYEIAMGEENLNDMKKYSSQFVRLDDKMIEEAKELLEAMGVSVIQAPGEGEAQASYLSRKKGIYGVVSQDYDSLVFGARVLIRNLTVSRKKKTYSGYVEVKPEIIVLDDLLKELEIDIDQLISLAILVGTDYNPKGVPMIGQKKALKIVKEFKTPERIFEFLKEKIEILPKEDKFDWELIFSLFRAPKTNDFELEFPALNFEKIEEILIKRHQFSEERIKNQLKKIDKINLSKNQKNLDKWF
ncbi:flap endonuclease-1 [Candidatus Pacearchaeota archaeon CG10_big_fil_rev_8_21_14_0_10_32_42]|nr:MAG: flap endonuclease-1 [Candidatus Pacearchaeota archaeon CG10_big_fil_rev_8_21_14_0_10_32_42]